MGLFDRFKSSTAPTQKGLTAKELCDKGDALAKSGRDEEALQCFDKALAIDPQYAKAWALKGATLGMLDRHEEALQCFDKALRSIRRPTAQQGKPVAREKIRKTTPKKAVRKRNNELLAKERAKRTRYSERLTQQMCMTSFVSRSFVAFREEGIGGICPSRIDPDTASESA